MARPKKNPQIERERHSAHAEGRSAEPRRTVTGETATDRAVVVVEELFSLEEPALHAAEGLSSAAAAPPAFAPDPGQEAPLSTSDRTAPNGADTDPILGPITESFTESMHPFTTHAADESLEEVSADDLRDDELPDAPLTAPGERSADPGRPKPRSKESAAAEMALFRAAQIDPDAETTAQFIAGSEQAFIQLYAKYEAPLLLYCKRMLSNERIAEDAFQEIWIRVFELRNRKDIQITYFRALLFRSARNLCLNMLRVERLRAGSSDDISQVLSTEETGRRTEQREIKALIRQALNKLPFDQREAFVLHEYSGYSFKEIAEMMGTTEVNVKVRAYRARTRLRKLIQGWLGLRETDDPTNVI